MIRRPPRSTLFPSTTLSSALPPAGLWGLMAEGIEPLARPIVNLLGANSATPISPRRREGRTTAGTRTLGRDALAALRGGSGGHDHRDSRAGRAVGARANRRIRVRRRAARAKQQPPLRPPDRRARPDAGGGAMGLPQGTQHGCRVAKWMLLRAVQAR